jgi:hypothetical protein
LILQRPNIWNTIANVTVESTETFLLGMTRPRHGRMFVLFRHPIKQLNQEAIMHFAYAEAIKLLIYVAYENKILGQ